MVGTVCIHPTNNVGSTAVHTAVFDIILHTYYIQQQSQHTAVTYYLLLLCMYVHICILSYFFDAA